LISSSIGVQIICKNTNNLSNKAKIARIFSVFLEKSSIYACLLPPMTVASDVRAKGEAIPFFFFLT